MAVANVSNASDAPMCVAGSAGQAASTAGSAHCHPFSVALNTPDIHELYMEGFSMIPGTSTGNLCINLFTFDETKQLFLRQLLTLHIDNLIGRSGSRNAF